MPSKILAPTRYLAEFNRDNPRIWSYLDVRRARSKGVRQQGIFATMEECAEATSAYIKENKVAPTMSNIMTRLHGVMGLGAWRVGQDVYRFHPALLRALMETEGFDQIPPEVLSRLPAWGVYIEASGLKMNRHDYDGFFAVPSWSSVDGNEVPILLITFIRDSTERAMAENSVMLTLNKPTIMESFAELQHTREGDIGEETRHNPFVQLENEAYLKSNTSTLTKAISLLLYLSSDPAHEDFRTEREPLNVKSIKGSARVFPAEKVREWELGLRIGAALQAAERDEANETSTGEHSSSGIRPHLRRAHFHIFRYGPRTGVQERRVRWLSPILVNAEAITDMDTMPTVVHDVAIAWPTGNAARGDRKAKR